MCDSFNVKKTVNRVKPELFSHFLTRHHIDMNVDWSESLHRYKMDIFQAYLQLAENDVKTIEPELVEISNFSAWVGAGEAIVRSLQAESLTMPQEYVEDTMLNQAMWLYLEYPKLWERLEKYALLDRVGKVRWILTNVQRGLEESFPDTDHPDLEKLKQEIGPYILGHQGRGKYIDITFEVRNDGDEYYVVDLSDFKRHETVCDNGTFNHEFISKRTAKLVFVYHRATKQLEALLPNFSRNEKLELCEKWARVIKNGYITGAEKEKPIYDLSPVLDPGFIFTPDANGFLESATPVGICISIRGCPNSKRIYLEKNYNIFEKMEQEINQRTLPRQNRFVEWVEVRVKLSEEFGRSRSQTLRITPNGHNILDMNNKVHAPLIEIVNGWRLKND